jgi:hypothetical protein
MKHEVKTETVTTITVTLTERELAIIEDMLNFADDTMTPEYLNTMRTDIDEDLTEQEIRDTWNEFYRLRGEI